MLNKSNGQVSSNNFLMNRLTTKCGEFAWIENYKQEIPQIVNH